MILFETEVIYVTFCFMNLIFILSWLHKETFVDCCSEILVK